MFLFNAFDIQSGHSITFSIIFQTAGVLSILYFLYSLIFGLYNIYFHRLSNIPGPKLWIIFPVFRWLSMLRGSFDSNCRSFFETFDSPIVRIGPKELIFSSAQAWIDIAGYQNVPQLPKPGRRDPERTDHVVIANGNDHRRARKALSHGFAEKTLAMQESLVQNYVNLLITNLRTLSHDAKPVNMVEHYNFATFDIIGDLAFGRCFELLRNQKLSYWVSNVLLFFRMSPIVRAAQEYPLLFTIIKWLQPKSIREARNYHWRMSEEWVESRINNESQRGRSDFIDSMLKTQGGKDELTDSEIVSNAQVLILAGSETTATLLSGLTFYLLTNAHAYRKLVQEIRTSFSSEDDITVSTVGTLPYLLACLEEGLRMYPPAPTTLPRETVSEKVVDGVVVPKGTHVGVHQYGANFNERNFKRAKEFLPERWLAENKGPGGEFEADERGAYQPFGFGPRICIGKNLAYAEMRLIVAKVFWSFDLELCPGQENWRDQKTAMVWLKQPLMVMIKDRKVAA